MAYSNIYVRHATGYDANSASQQKQSEKYDRQIRAATLKVAILGQMTKPSPMFLECINDHFRLKKRRILEQLGEWEEMEKKHEKDSGAASLVSGGGIRSTVKIVKQICDDIREFYDPTEKEEEDDDEHDGEEKS